MIIVQVEDQLKLIVVKSAEFTELLLDLLHDVHILSGLGVHSDLT